MIGDSSTDAVLVTIDCFRHDAPRAMPNLRSLIGDGDVETDAVAPSSSTPFVSPALLQSQLFSSVLHDAGERAVARYAVDGSVPSLPEVLSAEGYTTGAFVASNPNLEQYADHFDTYWNGPDSGGSQGLTGRIRDGAAQLKRLLLLQKRVSAPELIDRAREWYERTDGPTFLWMHFMEPHFPYYPGLRRGRTVGLTNAYRANLRLYRSGNRVEDIPERDIDAIRSLYWECVRRLDESIPAALEFVDDDALVALTGDHGEAFDHGVIGHSGLYDETVRVPLVLFNFPDSASDLDTVRQVDVPATILDALGASPPAAWDGVPTPTDRPLEALLARAGSKQGTSTTSVGLRTAEQKLIRHYDFETGEFAGGEFYDLAADPDESTDRYDPEDPPALQARLEEVIDERDFLSKLERFEHDYDVEDRPAVNDAVADRLSELGYT